MASRSSIKTNDWVMVDDGLAQVLSMHDLHIEEFMPDYYMPDYNGGRTKVGDFLQTMCVYKLLCDYDGKLRKRNRILSCNAAYCSPLDREYEIVIQKLERLNPDELERFRKVELKKPIRHVFPMFFHQDGLDLEAIQSEVELIGDNLPKPFVFSDFVAELKNRSVDLDLSRAGANPGITPSSFHIGLVSENYLVRDKRLLLVSVYMSIGR